MTGPAFVGASPVGARSFSGVPAATSAPARRPSGRAAPVVARATPATPVEFQGFTAGLDLLTQDPYKITRYLFKGAPSTLTEDEKDAVVVGALKQVFGNAYLMEEERAELYVAESKFRCGEITAKEFVRALAKSETYRKRFFESVSQFRFFELNFKHLLGRAPLNQVEYSKHFQIFAQGGYDAEIDSYFDGHENEYDLVFGEDVIPYTRFRGTYAPINQFNWMCSLEGGWAGSDKMKPAMLVESLATNTPTKPHTIIDGLPPIPNSEHPSKKYELPTASLERYRNEIEVAGAKALELQLELKNAYDTLQKAQDTINPFKAMVADMDITPLYGNNYGNGAVTVFSGQYLGAPAGGYGGPSGVGNIAGPARNSAKMIAKKEKQLEGIKQLVVDLERKVAILQGELDSPAVTPAPLNYVLQGIEQPEFAADREAAEMKRRLAEEAQAATDDVDLDSFDGGTVIVGGTAVVGGATLVGKAPVIVGGTQVAGTGTTVDSGVTVRIPDPDEEAEEELAAKPVVVTTARRADDDMLGPNPGELIEELEEKRKASGKDFLEGIGGPVDFPGDGSEMIVGG